MDFKVIKKLSINIISTTIIVLLAGFLFYPLASAAKTTPKTIKLPVPQISFQTNYFNKGQTILMKLTSTNYSGNVQYKITLKKPETNNMIDITNGYSGKVKSGTTYGVLLPAGFGVGSYKVTVYVKRAEKNINYDNYVTKTFEVKNDIIIEKEDKVYDLFPHTGILKGNINVNTNNAFLRNIKLEGNILVSFGDAGEAYMQSITANTLNIHSAGLKTLYLYNCDIKTLNFLKGNKNPIVVYAIGKTTIYNTTIDSKVEFKLSDKSHITKFLDKMKYSNLVKDKNIVYSTIMGHEANTTTAAITTGSAIAPVKAPPANIALPVNGEPIAGGASVPLLPLGDSNGAVVEYAAITLDSTKVPLEFNRFDNTYGIDLSAEPEMKAVQRVCITVSKDATLTINGVAFKLKAHTMKQIKVLEDFGITDLPPEGIRIVNARATFGDKINLVGKLNSGTSSPEQEITLIIKLN